MEIPSLIIILFAVSFSIVIFYCFYLSNKNFGLRNRIKDVMHQKAEISNFLSLFSQSLKDIDEVDNSMNTTARYIADLIEAESICIFEVSEDTLRAVGISGAFPLIHNANQYVMTKPKYILDMLRRERFHIGEGIIGEVAAARESLILEDATGDPRLAEFAGSAKISTMMVVPMVRDAILTGVICAVNNRRIGPFTPEQFSRLRFISAQVILAQNLVKVYSSLSEQQRLNQELEFARQLQASLLPESFPPWDQFVVHAVTRSSKEVSGDFYDFVEIDENRLLIVVADACGKGIPACMLMAMTRSFIRSIAPRFSSVEDLLEELNTNLFRDTDEERFVTLACCLVDKKNDLIEYARAGHTELLTFVRGHIRKIYPDGSALGILPSELAKFDSICFECGQDMTLLLFTDGITEAINSEGEEFGLERLQEGFKASLLNGDSLEQTINKILTEVDDFAADPSNHIDDQTMVIIQHV